MVGCGKVWTVPQAEVQTVPQAEVQGEAPEGEAGAGLVCLAPLTQRLRLGPGVQVRLLPFSLLCACCHMARERCKAASLMGSHQQSDSGQQFGSSGFSSA